MQLILNSTWPHVITYTNYQILLNTINYLDLYNKYFKLNSCLYLMKGWFVSWDNHLTPKIWLLILPSSCYKFPCKLVTRIWCEIKITTST